MEENGAPPGLNKLSFYHVLAIVVIAVITVPMAQFWYDVIREAYDKYVPHRERLYVQIIFGIFLTVITLLVVYLVYAKTSLFDWFSNGNGLE